MKILMIGDAAFTGENLTKGLRRLGHTVAFYPKNLHWSKIFRYGFGKQSFDIVHIHSPNFKKLALSWRYITKFLFFFDAKLVCHWHGSDLRHPMKGFPTHSLCKKIGDFHLYSTIDLRWWLRKIPDNKKEYFICPVDTDLFKPLNMERKGKVVFEGGGKSFAQHRVPHDKMPEYLNQFETVEIIKADGLDARLFSVLVFEAAACGCKVKHFPWMTREWVIKHASIESQTKKLLDIYNRII